MAVVAAVFEPVDRETRPIAANAATNAATIPTMMERRRFTPPGAPRRRARTGGSPRSGSWPPRGVRCTSGSCSQTNATATPQFGLTSRGPGTSRAGRPGPLEHALGPHRVLRGVERDDATPVQATAPRAARRLRARSAIGAQRLERRCRSRPRSCRCPRRSGPSRSGAVPRLRCAAGAQCRPARVITPHSSSSSRATVALGTPSTFSESDADAVGRVGRAVHRDPRRPPRAPPRKRRAQLDRAARGRARCPTSCRCSAAAPRPDDPDRVQSAALVAVGREVGLHLELRLAAGAAADQRLELDARREVEQARAGRAEQPLVARASPRRRRRAPAASSGIVAGALRGVDDQRHAGVGRARGDRRRPAAARR